MLYLPRPRALAAAGGILPNRARFGEGLVPRADAPLGRRALLIAAREGDDRPGGITFSPRWLIVAPSTSSLSTPSTCQRGFEDVIAVSFARRCYAVPFSGGTMPQETRTFALIAWSAASRISTSPTATRRPRRSSRASTIVRSPRAAER